MEHLDWIGKWFSQMRERSHLTISRIPLSASSEWSMIDGWVKHKSGRFFQVAGVRWKDLHNQNISQPFIVQQEIGTLGFALYNHKLLVQAKVEPGNVGIVQLAPTCQATASNLDRVHGGKTPMFADWFTHENGLCIHGSLQSEQGSRFFRKFNRNVLADVHGRVPLDDAYRWIAVDAALELMSRDFLVNTDARSVLVCSPWEFLVHREPFTRFSSFFARDLAVSFTVSNSQNGTSAVRNELHTSRTLVTKPLLVRLDELNGWHIDDGRLSLVDGKPFEIYQIKVDVAGREVSAWDQPIISSFGEGYVELLCGRINGILHFLFSFQIEAGLTNIVELGPSLVISPGETSPNTHHTYPDAVVLAEYRQSDEGGRFFQDITTYRLIDIGEANEAPENGRWLTIAQIRELLNEGGWFTNEARSALSLILIWL